MAATAWNCNSEYVGRVTRWRHHADSMGAQDFEVTLQIALDPGSDKSIGNTLEQSPQLCGLFFRPDFGTDSKRADPASVLPSFSLLADYSARAISSSWMSLVPS